MGFLRKIFKPISKVLDKVVPNELKPLLPYAAAFAPYLLPGTGIFASMAGRGFGSAAANLVGQLAQEGNEGEVNPLSLLLAGAQGAATAPGAGDKFRSMINKGKPEYSNIPRGNVPGMSGGFNTTYNTEGLGNLDKFKNFLAKGGAKVSDLAADASQTLKNLAVIDDTSEKMVLRPLIMSEKQDIIDLAKTIGTEAFSAVIPEYCGVISIRPTTRARLHQIEREEERFDYSILEAAIEETSFSTIDQLLEVEEKLPIELFELESTPEQAIVIDIRHPHEEELSPLNIPADKIYKIPFFKLNTVFESGEIASGAQYLLYCDKGMMSRLHASYLVEKGFLNVGVYRPS